MEWIEVLKVLGAEDFLRDVQSVIGGKITRPKSKFYKLLLSGGKVPVEVTRDKTGIYTILVKHKEGGYANFSRVSDLNRIVEKVHREFEQYGMA